jgi:hypothetical protein
VNRVVRRGAVPVLIALVAGTVAALPSSAAPTWITPPLDISLPTALAEMRPQVAVAPDGSATAVWQRIDPGVYPYVESSTRPAGGDWSAPVRISEAGLQAEEPQVAVAADGTATALWVRYSPPRILQSATRPPGGSWTEPVEVTSFFTDANPRTPQLAVDAAGTATAVWINDSGGTFVKAARGRPAGSGTRPRPPRSAATARPATWT